MLIFLAASARAGCIPPHFRLLTLDGARRDCLEFSATFCATPQGMDVVGALTLDILIFAHNHAEKPADDLGPDAGLKGIKELVGFLSVDDDGVYLRIAS